MSVTTYIRDGVIDCRDLLRFIVRDLEGKGTPVADGVVAEHMTVVYPVGFDSLDVAELEDDFLVIMESTLNMDPFARDSALEESPTDLSRDPWRIAFHTSKWTGRSTATFTAGAGAGAGTWGLAADPVLINSLAVYVGTPSTLYINADGEPNIGWNSRKIGEFTQPSYNGYSGPQIATQWQYKTTYKARDLVEPVGNTGAPWTNTFDPTLNAAKFQPTPTPATGGAAVVQPPLVYQSPKEWDGPDVTDPNQLFINKYLVAGTKAETYGGFVADSAYAYPMGYRIVLTDHGLFLGCWGPDPEENGKGFSWLLVQRPVDKKTGIVRGVPMNTEDPGNRPLFCVNSVNGRYWKFVVREHDSAVPSARKDATLNSPDSGAVINPYPQQSLTENGEYVITFLNNLNSSRFKYADELDMVGTVSSDVVGGGSEINVNVYSEENRRAYHALWSSGAFGSKMRIMVVKTVPSPNPVPDQ